MDDIKKLLQLLDEVKSKIEQSQPVAILFYKMRRSAPAISPSILP
jgi:hypothetical protein